MHLAFAKLTKSKKVVSKNTGLLLIKSLISIYLLLKSLLLTALASTDCLAIERLQLAWVLHHS